MRLTFFVALLILLRYAPAHAEECGNGGRCAVDRGYYLAALPKDWDGKTPVPLVVYFHGWNSSPEGSFRNRGMVEGVTKRGAIFVAPFAQTGYWRQIGKGRAEGGRDELAYIQAVMENVKKRWPIAENKTMAAGFSRGASMVWNVACYAGSLFHAYLPIAGGFWNSNPEACPGGPVNMRHIHGLSDGVVAFDKIGVYNSMPIPDGLTLYRSINQCRDTPNGIQKTPRLTCEVWSTCGTGRRLDVCTHRRGHSIR
ncbi:MAG: alpha/beta hydrolase family esterase, partial [Hyphomicrobiaceae bacterium]